MADRMGVRLEGAPLGLSEPRELVSQAVVPGSIQVPPDGQPILLMPECQTIGGYPQIGHVISADLPKLARAWPGTPIRFREVSLDDARRAWLEQEHDAALLQTGLDFLR
jgi:antagonist of KipI